MSGGHSPEGNRTARAAAPFLATALIVLALVLWWNWLVSSGAVNRIVLPLPSAVAESLAATVQHSIFWNDLRVTATEILVGFGLGGLGGFILATTSVAWPFLGRVLAPYIVTFQAVPKVVLLPLLAVWFEIGFASATVVVALVAFFPIYVSSRLGLTSVDPEGLRLLRSLRASRFDVFVKYRIPSAMPLIFTGAKVAVNYSILAAITAEFLGAREGLGYRIVTLAARLQLADLYAAVVVTSALAGVVYALLELADRRLVFWRDRPTG